MGGICGGNNNQVTISNCKNNGSIEGTSVNNSSGTVGGIIGWLYHGQVSNSSNFGSITARSNCIGGIGGANTSGEIFNCFNNGKTTSSGPSGIGGIVGYQANTSSKTSNCYNFNQINGVGSVGGIIGDNRGTIENSYNIGTINGAHISVGSITGNNNNEAQINNSYYLNTLSTSLYGINSGTVDSASTSKSEAEMKAQAFVDLLNADQSDLPWQLDTNLNNGYPIFKWQTEE